MISALSLGATIILFDGSPFHPDPGALFRLVEEEKITIFGTSAKYIDSIRKEGLKPEDGFNLQSLKTILSTGSPLTDENFRFVYSDVKEDVCLSSISGGTDLNGCFALGNPIGPVYAGVWRHGDFIEINDRGGVLIFGRSDTTLNPGGVRIGTAEIYRVVESLDEIEDSLVIGQDWEGDVRVILFVKLKRGSELTEDLEKKIRTNIRKNCSPRHVPSKVIAIGDIPYTINMKKVEVAVRKIIHGQPVLNRDALKNPESLDLFRNIPELKV